MKEVIKEVMNFVTEDEVFIQSTLKMNLMIHIEPLHPLRLLDLKLLPKL